MFYRSLPSRGWICAKRGPRSAEPRTMTQVNVVEDLVCDFMANLTEGAHTLAKKRGKKLVRSQPPEVSALAGSTHP